MSEILNWNKLFEKDLDWDWQEVSRLVEETSSELLENLTNTERQFFEYVNKIIWLDTNVLKNEITKIKDILYIDDAVFEKALSKVFKILFHNWDYQLAQKIAYIWADIFLINNNISDAWIRNIISCRIELEEILINDICESISSLNKASKIRWFEDTAKIISVLMEIYGKIANIYWSSNIYTITKWFFNDKTGKNDNDLQLIDIAKNTTESVNKILDDIIEIINNIISDNKGNTTSYIVNTATWKVEIKEWMNSLNHEWLWVLTGENLIKWLKLLVVKLKNIINENYQIYA